MELKKLQDELQSVLTEANGLIGDVGSRAPTEAEQNKLSGLSTKAQNLRSQIDTLTQLEGVKAWSQQGEGSVVAAAFSRESAPGEGEAPGVGMDARTGELYALDGAYKNLGAERIKALKSGEYKDAFNTYIRETGLKRANSERAGRAMKILAPGTDTGGGFWLPPDYRPDLVKRMATISTVRRNGRVFTTGTDSITFPQVQYTGSTTDDSLANLYTSGVRFAWRGATGSTSDYTEATNPVAGQINIPVNLCTATIIVTRQQVENNSFDILGYINELGAEAFGLGEEDVFTTGSGAGRPQGFMSHPSMSIAATTSGASGGVTYLGGYIPSGTTASITWSSTLGANYGITGVELNVPPQYEESARWYATKATFAAIRQINAGTSTLPQWGLGDSWPNYANNYSANLLGYGIQKNQFMPAVAANAYPLALGDMKGYYVVDRVGLSVEVNPYVYGLRDQVAIYMRKQVGGQLVDYWRMKCLKVATS